MMIQRLSVSCWLCGTFRGRIQDEDDIPHKQETYSNPLSLSKDHPSCRSDDLFLLQGKGKCDKIYMFLIVLALDDEGEDV